MPSAREDGKPQDPSLDHCLKQTCLAYEEIIAAYVFGSQAKGMVQRFEYTFELAWKTLKDYLQEQGVDARFPREVIKASYHYGLIEDGETWMIMLDKKNAMAHTYNENTFRQAVSDIANNFYPAITNLYHYLQKNA